MQINVAEMPANKPVNKDFAKGLKYSFIAFNLFVKNEVSVQVDRRVKNIANFMF